MTKFYVFLSFWLLQFGYCQNKKLLYGIITCEKNGVQGVEIINLARKTTTFSDSKGEFNILVNSNEMLIFIAKNYEHKQKFIEKSDIEINNLKIELVKKPEELKEVKITQKPVLTGFTNINAIIEKPYFDDRQTSPTNTNVYSGKTPGANIFAIIGLITNLIGIGDSKKTEEKVKLDFEEVVRKSCDRNFFEKTLNLKETEIPLFFEFCSKDDKVNRLLEPNEILGLMDFFIQKNKEFKMLPRN